MSIGKASPFNSGVVGVGVPVATDAAQLEGRIKDIYAKLYEIDEHVKQIDGSLFGFATEAAEVAAGASGLLGAGLLGSAINDLAVIYDRADRLAIQLSVIRNRVGK